MKSHQILRWIMIGMVWTKVLPGWISGSFITDRIRMKDRQSNSYFPQLGVQKLVLSLLRANATNHYGESAGTRRDRYARIRYEDIFEGFAGKVRDFDFLEIKEYRPEVFRTIRETAGIQEDQYLESLLPNNMQFLSDGMDSKSKQFFWKSLDDELLVKTMKGYECRTLRSITDIYKQHLLHEDSSFSTRGGASSECGTSCLGNVLGCYRITFFNRFGFRLSRHYIMINKNIFTSHHNYDSSIYPRLRHRRRYDLSRFSSGSSTPSAASNSPISSVPVRYDLKGSLVGRKKSLKSLVYKDLDIISQNQMFRLSPEGRRLLLDTLAYDTFFLRNLNLMDYSLLVQIDKPVSTDFPSLSFIRRFMNKYIGQSSNYPLSQLRQDRGKLVLSGEDGSIYHFGIIDFLQKYTFRKWLETIVKGLFYDYRKISCVHPKLYADRFLSFIDNLTIAREM